MTSVTDEDLVLAVQGGDTDSLGVLVARWEQPLFRFVYRLLPRREANTNWEYLDAVRFHGAVHEPLSHLTAIVDRVWYGHQTAHDEDYSRCRSFAGDVDRAVAEAA